MYALHMQYEICDTHVHWTRTVCTVAVILYRRVHIHEKVSYFFRNNFSPTFLWKKVRGRDIGLLYQLHFFRITKATIKDKQILYKI